MQLTLRGLDGKLEHSLRQLAAREGLSLNKAALKLMRRGAQLELGSKPTQPLVGDRLRRFSGHMREEEALAIEQAIAVARSAGH